MGLDPRPDEADHTPIGAVMESTRARNIEISCLAFAMLAIVWAAGCSRPPANRTVTVSDSDRGRTIELVVGDTLQVRLRGNPTTGFQWSTVAADSNVVRAAGMPQFISEKDLVGSPGTEAWRYVAVMQGSTRLELAYQRPFETGVAPAKTYDLNVVVRAP